MELYLYICYDPIHAKKPKTKNNPHIHTLDLCAHKNFYL